MSRIPVSVWVILALLVALAVQSYRLDLEQGQVRGLTATLTVCSSDKSKLDGLVAIQNGSIALIGAEAKRQEEAAKLASAQAKEAAKPAYQDANRILQGRPRDTSCEAAFDVIDQELGL